MKESYSFKLTPAYCLYNGAAVREQKGAQISFLIENEVDEVLKGRLRRAFESYVGNIRRSKDCPEDFRDLIKIDFESCSREELRNCISKLYSVDEKSLDREKEEAEQKSQREAAAVLLLDSILNEARIRKASDIHIENSCVRLRVNGLLETLMEIQTEKSNELVQRIKLLAGMNVIEKRRCQDGSFIYGNKNPFFLRVSTMSVVGEKYSGEESLVIRLLDTSRIPLSVEQLGFNALQLEKLCGRLGLTALANGLVLVCGPTGSGKSTTVASLLIEIEKVSKGALKIVSLEDPPEYVIPGVTQVKVDERSGFSEALNHIFRQDPDVIMIGEIRDEESAAAALRAALTGHLVFATLHAGSAGESIFRLENLGLDRRLLSQVLRGLVCQELNLLDGRMRLYADVALPKNNFSSAAAKAVDEEELEKLMEHFTNYQELLRETINMLKKKAEQGDEAEAGIKTEAEAITEYELKPDEFSHRLRRRRYPYFGRRWSDEGIHSGAL